MCSPLPQANGKLLRDLEVGITSSNLPHNTAASWPCLSHRLLSILQLFHYLGRYNTLSRCYYTVYNTKHTTLSPEKLYITRKTNLHAGISHNAHGTNFNVFFRFARIAVIRPFLESTRSEGIMLVAGPSATTL